MEKAMIDHDKAGVLLLYPGATLLREVSRSVADRPEFAPRVCRASGLPELHEQLRHASVAVIDATVDDARAIDAMVQAVAWLGRDAVVVYTRRIHEGMESFVRSQGVLLLFGPLDDQAWKEFFELRTPQPAVGEASVIPFARPRERSGWRRKAG